MNKTLPHFNKQTIEKFIKYYDHSLLKDINKFNLIKELGFPKISPIDERRIIRNDLYQQYLKDKENYEFFNNPVIHWILLDKNGQCNGILYLEFRICNSFKRMTEIQGVIDTIWEDNHNELLKTRFIEHFFLDKIDEEFKGYLEDWNEVLCNIIFYDKNIVTDLLKQLNSNIKL